MLPARYDDDDDCAQSNLQLYTYEGHSINQGKFGEKRQIFLNIFYNGKLCVV